MSAAERALLQGLVVIGMTITTFAAAGCSDSGDGGGDGQASSPKQADATGQAEASAGGDERQIHRTFYELQRRFYAGDGAGTCRLMGPVARDQAAGSGSLRTSCAENLSRIGKASADQSERAPNLLAIRVDGDRATVTAKKPESDTKVQRIPYVKEAGVWKMARFKP